MKRLLLLLTFLSPALLLYGQKKECEAAINAGREKDQFYVAYNTSKGKLIPKEAVLKYCENNGYTVGDIKTKVMARAGGYVYNVTSFEFLPEKEKHEYIFYKEFGNAVAGVSFESLTSTGKCYKFTPDGASIESEIKWSGSIKDGAIDGKGVGLIMHFRDQGMDIVSGTFRNGFPVSKTYFGSVRHTVANNKLIITDYKLYEITFGNMSDGLASMVVAGEELYGFVNPDGKIVIPKQFKTVVKDFVNGTAEVVNKDDEEIIIDKSGTFVDYTTRYYKQNFDKACAENTPQSYTKYIDKFPKSPHIPEVRQRYDALYNIAADRLNKTYNEMCSLSATLTPVNYQRSLSAEQQKAIRDVIAGLRPFLGNNYDPKSINEKVVLLDLFNKVDLELAYNFPRSYMESQKPFWDILGLFNTETFSYKAGNEVDNNIRSFADDATNLAKQSDGKCDGFCSFAQKAVPIFNAKHDEFVETYRKCLAVWEAELQRRREEAAARDAEARAGAASGKSLSSMNYDELCYYWQNNQGKKIRFQLASHRCSEVFSLEWKYNVVAIIEGDYFEAKIVSINCVDGDKGCTAEEIKCMRNRYEGETISGTLFISNLSEY